MNYLVVHFYPRKLTNVATVFCGLYQAILYAQQLVDKRGGFAEIRFE